MPSYKNKSLRNEAMEVKGIHVHVHYYLYKDSVSVISVMFGGADIQHVLDPAIKEQIQAKLTFQKINVGV